MSLPQAAEISLTYAQFLARLTGDMDGISWGPALSAGTRVFARENGVWRAFLITDLAIPNPVRVLKTGTLLIDVPAATEASGFIVAFANPPGLHSLGTVVNALVGFTSAPSAANETFTAQSLLFADQLSINVSRTPTSWIVDPSSMTWVLDVANYEYALDGTKPTVTPVYGPVAHTSVFWALLGTNP